MAENAIDFTVVKYDNTIGALVVSICICCLFYGMTLTQVWIYFASYPEDRKMFKALVAGLCVMTIGEVSMYCSWVYRYAVDYFAKPEMLAFVPWQMRATPPYAGAIAGVVHIFYAWRVWKVAGGADSGWRVYVIPGLILTCAALAFGCILYLAKLGQEFTYMTELDGYYPIAYMWFITAAVADVLITFTLWYYLSLKAPNILQKTRTTFHTIVVRAVQTNALSLFCQVAIPPLMIYGDKCGLWFAAPAFLLGPVYFFSLLITLNTRNDRSNQSSYGHTASAASDCWKGTRTRANKSAHGVQISVNQDITVDLEQNGSLDGHSPPPFNAGGLHGVANRQPFPPTAKTYELDEDEKHNVELRNM
ncbi:hypothetical protein OIO90_003333 [Microbotryomycetes sp. JL221]|nr:hypothetical protein OIO90_003333 [Microbotryomycetes sp. JL221]